MKAGQTKSKFEQKIKLAIYSISDNNIQEQIIDEIIELGGSRSQISDILEGNALLETIPLVELGVIADTMYRIADIGFLRLDIFLEEAEIDQVKKYKFPQEKENENLLVFENVTQVASDIWTAVVPAQRIAELYRNNAVGYDFETQRDAKNIKDGDSIIKVANVNWVSVEEIQEELIKGTFISNTITFNVPIEHAESIKFDRGRRILAITESVLTILDGFHRSLAIIGALRVAKINYNFEMRITCFNTEKAQRFIVQEDKRNPISKTYLKSIDNTDKITSIVNALNQSNSSELNGMITTDTNLITSGNALVSFNLMHDIMSKLWKPVTMVDVNNISKYLTDFFNVLVSIYPKELKTHIRQSKRINIVNNEAMFVVYLVIAKKLENDKNWTNKLKNIIQVIICDDNTIQDFSNISTSTIRQSSNRYIKIAETNIKGVFENEG